MRKTERIDQILIRLGHVTTDEVEQAVARQREHGGRIGKQLIDLGALTEEQLFDGLVEQFRLPSVTVDEGSVPRELLGRMPKGVVGDSLILPIGWNESLGVLSVAVANPSEEDAIERVRDAFGAKKVRISLAPESVLSDLADRLAGGEGKRDSVTLVALPELFEPEPSPDAAPSTPEEDSEAEVSRRVVMVSGGAVRKNFLPAVLRAEGYELLVVDEAEEAADAVPGADFVLVAPEMREHFREWVAAGEVPMPKAEVVDFPSVSEALLANPAPYAELVASLGASVHAVAEYRAIAEGVAPPYSLMANDAEVMAEKVGLGRLASDGLNLGLHLLVPVEAGTSIDPFHSFAASIELAHRIHFPWPVDALLSQCLGLYLGRIELAAVGDPKEEVLLAAQLLALVWFRHNLAPQATEQVEDAVAELRTSLRELAGRFATLDVVETYLDVITDRGAEGVEIKGRKALLVGGNKVERALTPALTRIGCEVTRVADMASAQAAAQEVRPDAVVVDHGELGADAERVCRVLRVDRSALIFVMTDTSDPALVLNLLDIGVDDVFGPPHDFEVMAARIQRAIRARAAQTPQSGPADGQFSARFESFSFIDLAQMLANGLKTARVELRGKGEEAVLYMQAGRPVFSSCGALVGPEAVYRIVSWEEDGEFSVHDAEEFPEPNIAESIESLLMEGVRLLDESRA